MKREDCLENQITLPKGVYIDVAGIKYDKLFIREFDGYDEEEVSKPAYRENIAIMQEVAISRCISGVIAEDGTRIDDPKSLPTAKQIRALPIGVIDLLLLELRAVTYGETYKKSMVCPSEACKQRIEPEVQMQEMRDEVLKADFSDKDVTLTRGILVDGKRLLKAKVMPVTGNIRVGFFNKDKDIRDFGASNSELILDCVPTIDNIKTDLEMVRSMKKIDRTKIFECLGKLTAYNTKRRFTCPYCDTGFDVEVDLLDFLF